MPEERTEHRGGRAQDVALFRYALVREATDEKLSKAERGRIVRALAETTHTGPDGTPVTVSRPTIDRWIRAYRSGGFAALAPSARRTEPTTPAGLLMLACDLRREDPARTAAHIAEMITATHEWSPSPRTLQRHFAALGLTRAALTGQNVAFGRFEATRPNELWVGDALHGPVVGARKRSCSRSSTTTPASSPVTVGPGRRTPSRRSRPSAEASCRGACPARRISITARVLCRNSCSEPSRSSESASSIAVPGSLKVVERSKDFSAPCATCY